MSDLDNKATTRNELSGTVFGPTVQAGTIHGGVHVHEPAHAPTPVPHQLPPPPANFVSRLAELAELSGAGPLVVLSGPGGVGKTSLALAWAHGERDRFGDGQLYVDLGGFSGQAPVDPSEAICRFLRALGVSPQRIPVTLAEQTALYRSITAVRSLLVVLDNAYSAAQARVLVPAHPTSRTVVTSRSRLAGLVPDGARLIEVSPLPPGDSVALLARTVGQDRIDHEPAATGELVKICAGLPIALCVSAARLAARPQLTVSRLVAILADEAGRLDALTIREGPSVRAALDVSYRSLEPVAAALYRRLALHPGPEFGVGPIGAVLASAADPLPAGAAEASAVIEELLDANLLEEVADERFRFHDLLRLHASRQAGSAERSSAVLAMLEWYFAAADRADRIVTPYRRRLPYRSMIPVVSLPRLDGHGNALDWLERERVNLTAAGLAALEHGHAELAWHLSDAMWPLFLYRKHFRDRLAADRRGVKAAQLWGNAWAEADMRKRLCGACAAAGDVDEAEHHARRAIVLCEQIGDARGAVDAREALAKLLRDYLDRPEEAAHMLTEVLATNRRLADPRRIGLTLMNLGMVLPRLGRHQQAVRLLEEAQALFVELSQIDSYNEVRVLIALASAYLGIEDPRRAEDAATEALRRMRDLGAEHGQAEALEVLGQVAEWRGNTVEAGRIYRLALDTFMALGSRHEAGVRDRLAVLERQTKKIVHDEHQSAGVPEAARHDPSRGDDQHDRRAGVATEHFRAPLHGPDAPLLGDQDVR